MLNLDLKIPNNLLCQTLENGDDVLASISKYQNHLSIKILKKRNFIFLKKKECLLLYVRKEIKSLDTNEAFHSTDIPTKFLKQNADLFCFHSRLYQ